MNTSPTRQLYAESVVYYIYTPSFCDGDGDGVGDCAAILGKLDYLQSLGVDTLLLEAADQGLATLIAETHKRGMRLMVVASLDSTDVSHPMFGENIPSDSAKNNCFIWRDGRGKHHKKAPDNRRANGQKVWRRQDNGLFVAMVDGRPLLNPENLQAKAFVQQAMLEQLSLGVDGFVWDMRGLSLAFDIVGDNARQMKMHQYMMTLVANLRHDYPNCMVVAAIGDAQPAFAKQVGQWADGVLSTQHLVSHGRPDMAHVKHTLSKWQHCAYGQFGYTLLWETSTSTRVMSRLAAECGDYRKEAACSLAAAMGMACGTPMVYQGQEIGMTNYPFRRADEIEDLRFATLARKNWVNKLSWVNKLILRLIGQKATDNARTAMPWTALLPNAGFSPAEQTSVKVNPNYKEINVQDAYEQQGSVLQFYRQMLALRHDPVLGGVIRNGTYTEYKQSGDLYVYSRSYKGISILVVCNLGNKQVPFAVPNRIAFHSAHLLLANYEMPAHMGTVTLRPYECICYHLK